MKIMFICTGNICRSAMAHYLAEKKAEELGKKEIEIYSCGVYAMDGDIAPYEERMIMKEEYDIDISTHRATNIRNSNIKEMDLILCATISHKNEVIERYPEQKEKVFTMKEYVNYKREYHNDTNIKDPWGYDIDTYRSCVAEIEECVDLLFQKLN